MTRDRFVKVKGKRSVDDLRLYALSTCIWCRKTKRFLDKYEIDYEYVDVDELDPEERNEAREEVKRLAGKTVFPTIVVDRKVIAGYDESKFRELLESDEEQGD